MAVLVGGILGDFLLAPLYEPSQVYGEGGNDTISGSLFDDRLYGGWGPDIIFGLDGDDYIKGGKHSDALHGMAGDDEIRGGKGGDNLHGDSGDDWISGGKGRDKLEGNGGNDTLTGGKSADRFSIEGGDDLDVITDFGRGRDVIELRAYGLASFADVLTHAAQSGADTVITGAPGDVIILRNTVLSSLEAADFVFL